MNDHNAAGAYAVLIAAAKHGARAAACLLPLLMTGCASWTNPVANGVPARLLPTALLAEPKDNLEMVPLALLRQQPPDVYRLGPGDLLGVHIEGVLGAEDQLPPVNFPQGNLPPSIGYPLPVRADGTLPLPLVEPLKVEGLTIDEAEQRVTKAYVDDKSVIVKGEERILVTLIRPRQTRVLVIREDSPGSETGNQAQFNNVGFRRGNIVLPDSQRGTGDVILLPAYENDVLTALARTGGLPGTDAVNEIIIQRGYATTNTNGEIQFEPRPTNDSQAQQKQNKQIRTLRIPLRVPQGTTPTFSADDIILQEGDIVLVRARQAEFYYTGGLLPSQENPMPRDYDLDVVEAIARVGGPIINGGVNTTNFAGGLVNPGIGNPSPSLVTILRRTEDRRQVTIRVDLNDALRDPRENILVKAGDVLLLQETPGEALARYFKDTFSFSIISNVINRSTTTGTASTVVP